MLLQEGKVSQIFGPETNDLVLQLRKRKISKIILGGMLANMCVESHLRELLEQGFEVAVAKWSSTDCKFAGFTPSVVRIHSYPSFSQSHSSSVLAVWRAIGHFISSERYHASSLFRPAENATSRCASIAASRWDRTREIEL
jgi:Isochorismatase family